MKNVMICEHAKDRMKQRMGIKSESKRQSIAEDAFAVGLRLDQANTCASRKYIQMASDKATETDRIAVLHRDFIFIFEDAVLVTVYQNDSLVKRLQNERAKLNKTKNKIAMRNCKVTA